jgi:CRISPR-associated protein Csy1
MDQAIVDFFSGLKENWSSKKIKPSFSEEKTDELIKECNERYELKRWLSFAAESSEKRALSSHPSKFSHPDVGASITNIKNKTYVSPIIFKGEAKPDGFLRTGNVLGLDLDSTGNGAEVGAVGEIGALLSMELSDGKRFYEHLVSDSKAAKGLLNIGNKPYDELKKGLLRMIKDYEPQTNSKIKQVYFPVADEYHLLSILTNSGLLFKLRGKINQCRYGSELALLRDNRKNNQKGETFKEIYNLAEIGYGGTQPNNISTINNTNAGKAALLMSMPPSFKNRDVQFPTTDIFKQNIRYTSAACRSKFYLLDRLYKQDRNNAEVRAKRDELYQDLVDYVLETVWQVRSVKDQYLASHSTLSMNQRIWLQVAEAPENNDWLEDIIERIALFIFHGYEKVLSKKAVKLGAEELKQVLKVVEKNKEILR